MTATATLSWDQLEDAIKVFVEDMERKKRTGDKSFRVSGSIGQPVEGPNVKLSGKAAGTFESFAARLRALK